VSRRLIIVVLVCAGCGSSGNPTLTIELAGTASEGSVTSTAGLDCGDACRIN
jgi:hypothetical protein